MVHLDQLKNLFLEKLDTYQNQSLEPESLYEPTKYILSLGGKRLRPLFCLLSCDYLGGDNREAVNAAMAVEVFHNFTLLHDDIMDKATLRRNQPTVHIKYNVNTAILSGDVMMIQAYQYLLDYKDINKAHNMMQVFNKMAKEVCEGQQMDMDFEQRMDVTIDEYIQMITFKTSVLLGASAHIGAICANADSSQQLHMYEFAKNFGIAFQIQDDILDTFGNPELVGKTIGGDIVQRKKTYLFLKALELADENQKKMLMNHYFESDAQITSTSIEEIKSIFSKVNVLEYATQLMEGYKDLAISHLKAATKEENPKLDGLIEYINLLICRDH